MFSSSGNPSEDSDDGDVVNGTSAADADNMQYDMVEQLMALNSTCNGNPKARVTVSTTTTTDAIDAAMAEVQGGGRRGLRSAGQCRDNDAMPNEHAGLRAVDEATRNTTCRCACCGYTCLFGLHLGRALTFEHKQTSMWGASSFEEHPVAKMVMQAAVLLEEHGWRQLTIPFCDRDFLDNALRGSSLRAEAAAMHSWHQAALDRAAQVAKHSAVELPFVEPAPSIPVDFTNGLGHVQGVPLTFICIDRAHVLKASAALRALWAHDLTPEVVKGYNPIELSEETVLRIVASATIRGDCCAATATGEQQATLWIERENMATAVCQMDSATLETVRAAAQRAAAGTGTAHEVALMRASLRSSAVSHVLAPCGGCLDRQAEGVARRSEAEAFKLDPGDVANQSFCRSGAAAGMFNAGSAAERLAQHADVQARAGREWPGHITFLAPSDTSKGLKSVAMRYISDTAGRARKRKSSSGSTSMPGDGPNQPRYVHLHPPLRGIELDGDALGQLHIDESYMTRVRIPQQDVTGRILLTLLHHGYGLEALSVDQTTNPFETSAVTWLRVCSESLDFDRACHYFASGTRASVVLQPLAVHVDGVAQRRRRHRPAVELVTTRWAEAAHSWTDSQRVAEMVAARHVQPLLASSVWLRTSIALYVRPCRGLALVAVRAHEPQLCAQQH